MDRRELDLPAQAGASRRQVLRAGAVAAGAVTVWTAPTLSVLGLTPSSAAQASTHVPPPPPPPPPPVCTPTGLAAGRAVSVLAGGLAPGGGTTPATATQPSAGYDSADSGTGLAPFTVGTLTFTPEPTVAEVQAGVDETVHGFAPPLSAHSLSRAGLASFRVTSDNPTPLLVLTGIRARAEAIASPGASSRTAESSVGVQVNGVAVTVPPTGLVVPGVGALHVDERFGEEGSTSGPVGTQQRSATGVRAVRLELLPALGGATIILAEAYAEAQYTGCA